MLCCVPSLVQLFANPMEYSLTDSSVHGIFKARILELVAISYSRDLPHPRIKPLVPPALEGRFFTTVPSGKYKLQLGSAVYKENPH